MQRLVIAAKITTTNLYDEMNKFDTDGNGFIDNEEITEESKAAVKAVASDTGRALAPFTGLFISPIYSSFWHFAIGFPYIRLSSRKKSTLENKALHPTSDIGSA